MSISDFTIKYFAKKYKEITDKVLNCYELFKINLLAMGTMV
ncbi:hypothetical protein KsCSTR_42070 [Candidatus Kuenenia stuttgartiensis]|uniref:Uncharacterized protein n=1 Tax=Kuenenia stuttgartiensis TaxID=174633 RepID=A0A6G7GVI5_KUEST|nr:hypothetical protein KsCSTR_42070 [Candidatus Kuenenia stuttgartiensis]